MKVSSPPVVGKKFLRIRVDGAPKAKKRMAPGRGKRGPNAPQIIYNPGKKDEEAFRQAIRDAIENNSEQFEDIMKEMQGPCRVCLTFGLKRLQTHYVKKGEKPLVIKEEFMHTLPRKTPDIDNLVKFVLDSIQNNVIIKNNRYVITINATKEYVKDGSDGYTELTVEKIERLNCVCMLCSFTVAAMGW